MTRFGYNITLLDTTAASVNINSEDANTHQYKSAHVQIITSGLNASDGVVKLQDSFNATDWNDIPSATVTVLSTSSTHTIRVPQHTGGYIRAVWTKGSVSAGNITIYLHLKK